MQLRTQARKLAALAAFAAAGSVIALAPSAPAQAAGGCHANNFCAFRDDHFRGLLLESSAPRGTNNIGVARDEVSSGSNRTNNTWVGVNVRSHLPDQVVFRFGPGDTAWVGAAANDKIDHFDVR
jgi:hypothetical protein